MQQNTSTPPPAPRPPPSPSLSPQIPSLPSAPLSSIIFPPATEPLRYQILGSPSKLSNALWPTNHFPSTSKRRAQLRAYSWSYPAPRCVRELRGDLREVVVE
ncbi:hypothetical protein L211DRAFT_642302 [Terfezia boudieri ATCC MYA-4762]|uniref:Uncharacterized protein n=1 Tax=Terfezia boudieri ATCC MYA-4762 TaxID=1051890 RepID=A0A3N4LCL0_9PEZI|nr:hypothetical protein L211DRAFT_642302 [Terfezia boudieri ATCC MYA-4762]